MKLIFVLCLILVSIKGSSVSTTKTCTCTQLVTQSDCIQKSDCTWDSTTKCTALTTTDVTYYSVLCSSITDATTCAKTIGCAYISKKCIPFSDCISFDATTNSGCQGYSWKCNWSPSKKYCDEGYTCTDYTGEGNQTQCESVLQPNGSKWCKFDTTNNTCAKLTCEDFTKTTNDDCKSVLADTECKTDTTACVTSLKACSSYKIDVCLTVSASDSPCELSTDGTKCQARTCAGATTEYQSTDKCKEYKSGCVFNGKACTNALLSCDKYTLATIDDCPSYIGTKGQCELKTANDVQTCANPADPTCESYTKTTDADCKAANTSLSCITNGINCVAALADTCATTTVTTGDQCNQVIAKDGKCILNTGTTCKLDPCTDQTQTTNDACGLYSTYGASAAIVCVTNGAKCLAQKKCTEYTVAADANNNNCSTLTGSDGICKNDTKEGATACLLQECADIPSPTSQAVCTQGNSTCKFDGVSCVAALKACTTYSSTDCEKVTATSTAGQLCALDSSSKCVPKTCLTAPNTATTDTACDTYLTGCKTNGYGCVTQLAKCSTYTGTQTACEKYIGSDGKCTGGTTSGACSPKDCTTSTATTDDACQAYSPACLYNASTSKCAQFVTSCSSVTSSQASCVAAITKETTGRVCKWVITGTTGSCEPATCNDITSSGSTAICTKFLSTCKFDGIGCYNTASYGCANIRTKTDCKTDSSGNACVWNYKTSTCFQFNKCEDYTFTVTKDATGNVVAKTSVQLSSETAICAAINSLCYSNGTTCVPFKPCAALLTKDTCVGVTGLDNKACGWDNGNSKCQTFGNCTDLSLATHADCQLYSTTCTSDGAKCAVWGKCASISDQSACTSIGGTDGKCTWDTTSKSCRSWVCTDEAKTTYAECQVSSSSCATDGTTCISLTNCSNYNNKDSCVKGTDNNSTSTCFYDSTATTPACRLKTCTDYTAVSGSSDCTNIGCAYNQTAAACIDKVKCTAYTAKDICNQNTDSSTNATCLWVTSTTTNTTTCQAYSACSDAHEYKTFCNAQSNCYFVDSTTNSTTNTTTASQCKTVSDCGTYNTKIASNSTTGCKPYLSGKTLTFCSLKSGTSTCVEGDATSLEQSSCFSLSQYTYYWSSNTCISCSATNTTNTTNSSNSTNGTNSTTTNSQSGIVTALLLLLVILFQ